MILCASGETARPGDIVIVGGFARVCVALLLCGAPLARIRYWDVGLGQWGRETGSVPGSILRVAKGEPGADAARAASWAFRRQLEAPPPPPCPGVGRLVRYDDFKTGRSTCPVCGHESQIADMRDRDPSVFVHVGDHAKKEKSK